MNPGARRDDHPALPGPNIAPGTPPTYIGMCHIFSDSVESFQAGLGPHAHEILADIANYTDLAPVMQISEVVVGHPA